MSQESKQEKIDRLQALWAEAYSSQLVLEDVVRDAEKAHNEHPSPLRYQKMKDAQEDLGRATAQTDIYSRALRLAQMADDD